jgi:hypothetical protein
MFNYYAKEKANEFRRAELLEKAAQERLAREFEGDSPSAIARFKALLKRIVPSAGSKNVSPKLSARKSLQESRS